MSDKNKKIIICAGGTGGHVFPAKKLSEMLLKETVEIIQQNNAKTVAAIVALDRMEKDANSLTFKENLEKSLSIPILSIATFEDLKK